MNRQEYLQQPTLPGDELHAEHWLREFFRRLIPQQLPPVTPWDRKDTASQAVAAALTQPHSCVEDASYQSDAIPVQSSASASLVSLRVVWSRLVLLITITLLGWLLLLVPWLAPKPSAPWRLDPREGIARDKPNPVALPQPITPSMR
ncbi:MAG: hypothetical protein RMI91_00580 [Gemmatales bacterium]|nr:hypothetical protein [Gemmatales bacterium]MDW7993127.1 hypothetical protein [Gemmatales bacterium]